MSNNSISLYLQTLRHLKPEQFIYRVKYSVRNKISGPFWRNKFVPKHTGKSFPLKLKGSIAAPIRWIPYSGTFKFLNKSVSFDKIDWNDSRHGKLWCYNLNYHEFLLQDNISWEQGVSILKDYSANHEVLKDGLEPYPQSLRIINWIKFLLKHNRRYPDLEASLWNQAQLLTKQLEFHLLGNHLLENGFALLFAAAFFRDEELRQLATSILTSELEEQVLSDGAHFELSPMYHQLMTYRVLDSYNLISSNLELDQSLCTILKDKAHLMLSWLGQISFQSGRIPLLNDSAEGITPTSHELFEYATTLGLHREAIPLGNSGYRKFKSKNIELIFDVGQAGPNYIPGHAHADALSIVCEINEKPFLVDSGTSTYETCTRRQKERSTSAHNTVQFGTSEQLEVWGSFRVARRNSPTIHTDEHNLVAATIKHAASPGEHYRSVSVSKGLVKLTDKISNFEIGIARFHLHPNCSAEIQNHKVITNLATITFEGAKKIIMKNYDYAPGFNSTYKAKCIEVYFEVSMNTTITGF